MLTTKGGSESNPSDGATGCYKSVRFFDSFLEVFAQLPHLGWYAPQSAEEIVGRRLNHAPIKDSETTISLALVYDLLPVTGFDLPIVVAMEVVEEMMMVVVIVDDDGRNKVAMVIMEITWW